MNVIVTGATGFLGTALCEALRARGDSVIALGSRSADLRVAGSLDAFNASRFDRIFHLAAWTQAGDFCLTHPGEQWIFNQQINTNVLDWWHTRQPQAKLIAIGTSCAYSPNLPLTEANYLKGEPLADLFTYAMSKRMLFAGLLALSRQFGHTFLQVVPSTLYGPEYHLDGRQMHFIFDLMRKIIIGHTSGSPVVLWGDGHQRREIIFVRDFVRLLLRLDERVENEIVNIGAGEDFSIREFAQQISMLVGYNAARIEYDEQKYTGARSKRLETEKLVRIVGDPQFTPLEAGLQETLSWLSRALSTDRR